MFERVAILGGADPLDPLEPNNRVRHLGVGALLLVVAAWACIAVTAMFRSNLQAPWALAIAGGVLVAGVIFFIDLLITCTPLKKDTAFYRFRIILIRGAISLAMGLIIAHATILFIYRDALGQIVSGKNQAVEQSDAKRIRAGSQWTAAITLAQKGIDSDGKQIAKAEASLKAAPREVNHSRTLWLNDEVCRSGGRAKDGGLCGPGPISTGLYNTFQQEKRNLPSIELADNNLIASMNADIAKLTGSINADRIKLNREIQAGIKADRDNVGVAAQSEALWTLLRQDALLWLWPIFFIVIDLAVALMKGILPESEFDRVRRRDREQDEALRATVRSSPVWQQVAQHVADRQADIARARADAAVDRERNAIRARQVRSARRPRLRLDLTLFSVTAAAATIVFVLVVFTNRR